MYKKLYAGTASPIAKIYGKPKYLWRLKSLLGNLHVTGSCREPNFTKDRVPQMASVPYVAVRKMLTIFSLIVCWHNLFGVVFVGCLVFSWTLPLLPTSSIFCFLCQANLVGLFAAQSWELWQICNKFSIEAKFPKQPADFTFKTLFLLQHWRQLQRPRDLPALEEMVQQLTEVLDASFMRTQAPSHP